MSFLPRGKRMQIMLMAMIDFAIFHARSIIMYVQVIFRVAANTEIGFLYQEDCLTSYKKNCNITVPNGNNKQ